MLFPKLTSILSFSLVLSLPLIASADVPGFVCAEDGKFKLDNKDFFFSGTNAYWLGQLADKADLNATMKSIADTGLKVVRTWAFNEVTSVPTDGSAWYHFWVNGSATINFGTDGLQRLDGVMAAAEANGLKMILTFVNNWNAYGGMDTYTSQLGNSTGTATHDVFYTNPAIISAYRDYITVLINRYKSSSAVFAWELANEPRCVGNIPASATCTTDTLTTWIASQSCFIKSLDPDHMVILGDEGFLDMANSTDANFDGAQGTNYPVNLALPCIDAGTFHLYPISWSEAPATEFGEEWIQLHAAAGKAANKPIILEEFGMPTSEANQTAVYTQWYQTARDVKTGGTMFWQWGQRNLTFGNNPVVMRDGLSPQDGYAIYSNMTDLVTIIKQDVAIRNSWNI